MTIYVDELRDAGSPDLTGRGFQQCRMFSDVDEAELIAFAKTVGAKNAYYQPPRSKTNPDGQPRGYYILYSIRRALAIKRGAREIEDVRKANRILQKLPTIGGRKGE